MSSQSFFKDHSFAISSFDSNASSLSFTTDRDLKAINDSLEYHRENNRRKHRKPPVLKNPKRKIDDNDGNDDDFVRLLIHASAPSAGKDDTLYRKQAQAVLNTFEVARRLEVGRIELPQKKKRRLSATPTPTQTTPSQRRGSIHSQAAYLISFSSDESFEAALQEIMAKDIDMVAKSPRKQTSSSQTTPCIASLQQQQASSHQSPHEIRQTYEYNSEPSSPLHNYILPEESWELSSPTIPDSYQPSPAHLESLLQTDCELQFSLDAAGDLAEISNQVPPSQQQQKNHKTEPEPTRAFIYSIPPPSKDSLTQLSSISALETPPDLDTQRSGISTPDRSKRLPLFTPFPEPPLSSLVPEQQIISPPPDTNSRLALVTGYLEKLKEGKIWETYYRPTMERELRDMERGCWVVDTSGWTRKEKIEFWDQIKPGIQKGRCGAVTVFIAQDGEGEGGGRNFGIGRKRTGDKVQVFCWGKAAELMWGYLLVFSNMKTKTGIYWEDASGKVVIKC